MALSRIKTWISGEILTASDLNAEFNNVLNNATSLISPLTAALDMNGIELILDADADTSVTADTDDQIDFKIGGTDLVRMTTVASAVNGIEHRASATLTAPSLRAFGTDSHIPINLVPKGTAAVQVNGEPISTLPVTGINRLINGGFQVWQRGVGSTSTADDTYSIADRWYVLVQTATINVVQASNPENGARHAVRLTQDEAGAQRMGLAQIIEGINCVDLRGSAVVLSGRIRCSSAQAIRYAILEWTGTEDSPTSDVVADWTSATFTTAGFFISTTTTLVATGSTTPLANTWTAITELTGTVSSSANNLIVFFWTEGTAAQNVTLDLSKIQLEAGSVATRFQRVDYQTDFERCLRYFERITSTNANQPISMGVNTSTTTQSSVLLFRRKRTTPTVAVSAVGDFIVFHTSGTEDTTNLTADDESPDACTLLATVASGLTDGQASRLEFDAASKTISVSAEL